MTESFTEIRRGYCPEFDDDYHKVQAHFLRGHYLGGRTSAPHLASVHCPEQEYCRFYNEHNYCPLINEIDDK